MIIGNDTRIKRKNVIARRNDEAIQKTYNGQRSEAIHDYLTFCGTCLLTKAIPRISCG